MGTNVKYMRVKLQINKVGLEELKRFANSVNLKYLKGAPERVLIMLIRNKKSQRNK